MEPTGKLYKEHIYDGGGRYVGAAVAILVVVLWLAFSVVRWLL